jgi:hypothetical protein
LSPGWADQADARVVDEGVDVAESFLHGSHQLCNVLLVGHVTAKDGRFPLPHPGWIAGFSWGYLIDERDDPLVEGEFLCDPAS